MPSDTDNFGRTLADALRRWRIPISLAQIDLLRAHFEAVVDTNRTINLTRITEPVPAAVKHYADSLALLLWARQHRIAVKTVLDVGTGAGYPAVPLAILRPDWTVTAIDATGKKVRFLTRLAKELQLTNLHVEHAHSRHWPGGRHFQVVVLRAFGRLAECLEQAAPYVASPGWLVAYKTASLDREELRPVPALITKLNLRPAEPFSYELNLRGEVLCRTLRVYQRSADG